MPHTSPVPVDTTDAAPERHGFFLVRVDPSEPGRLAKTGEFDTSVSLDQSCHQHLAAGLLVLHLLLGPQAAVFPMNVATIGKLYMNVLQNLNLTQLGLSLCSCRQWGASVNRASGSRSLLEIQKRGGLEELHQCAPIRKTRPLQPDAFKSSGGNDSRGYSRRSATLGRLDTILSRRRVPPLEYRQEKVFLAWF